MAKVETWQDVLDNTCERFRNTYSFKKFVTLRSNEERINFCLKDNLVRPRLQHWLNILCSAKHRKHWEKASELRNEGNLYFSAKRYDRAVEFYTKSILSAPFPDLPEATGHEEELPLGFANRSAALFYLGKFKECLRDVTYSFKFGYPVPLHFKLHLRRGQCLLKLKKGQQALEAFENATKSLSHTRLDAKKLEEIDALKAACRKLLESNESKESEDEDESDGCCIPDITHGWHSSIPYCSSSLDMLYSTEKGRFIVSNRELNPGDTIFIEKPYASVLLPNYTGSHCHHCYDKLTIALPCRQCNQVRYCSFSCGRDSWHQYHKWECGNLELLYSVGIAHLAIRVILMTGLSRLLEFNSAQSNLDGNIKLKEYKAVYDLVTHSQDMHIEDVFQYSLTASLLLLLLDRVSFFTLQETSSRLSELSFGSDGKSVLISGPSSPIKADKLSLGSAPWRLLAGGLLLRHIQQLVCNAHAITSLESVTIEDDDVVMTQEQVRIATAIYPSASLMNHSCDPNIISGFYKDILFVRVVRDVPKGEEVYNCYGPHFRRMSFVERQKALQEQYFFTCSCEPCSNLDEAEQRLQALICKYCSGPLRQPNDGGLATCIDCKASQECMANQQKAFVTHDLYVQGVQFAEEGYYTDALLKLKKCLKVREKIMYKHNQKLLEVKDMIARCLAGTGNFVAAADILKSTILAVREIYGNNSIELANELQKYSDVQVNAVPQIGAGDNANEEAKQLIKETKLVISEAKSIFTLHYGAKHRSVQDLISKEKTLQNFKL